MSDIIVNRKWNNVKKLFLYNYDSNIIDFGELKSLEDLRLFFLDDVIIDKTIIEDLGSLSHSINVTVAGDPLWKVLGYDRPPAPAA
jgi:hypothetical protein